jgi:copper transport protein
VGFVGAPGAATTAYAHAGLESSEPAASDILEQGPAQIVLDFDEPIESAGASIDLFDDAGTGIDLGEPTLSADDDSVLSASAPTIDDGTYAVVWRIVSVDGHVIDGAFSFQVGTAAAADAGALLDRLDDGAGADRAVSTTFGAARALGYLGVALLLGGGLLRLLSGGDHRSRRFLLIVGGGCALALVSTAVAFGMYATTVSGGRVADVFDGAAWSTAMDTRTGHMLIVRLVALVIATGLVVGWGASRAAWWRATAVIAAIAVVVTFPASGHAGAVSPAALWVTLGALHAAGGLVWVGGLAMVAVGGVTSARHFSIVSTIAIPVVVVTGSIQTLELVDDLDDLTATTWGRVLLVKIAVVVVALSVAGVSRWLVVHAAGASLRRTVVTEGVLGLGVIALAAGLVALPPTAAAESRVFQSTIAEAGLLADVTVTPGRVGANDVHIVVTPPGSSIRPVVGLTARMSLPSRDLPASPVSIVDDGPNHFTGRITLPFSGDWTLELIIEATAGSTILLKATVPIP